MKRMLCLLMLLSGISQVNYAQSSSIGLNPSNPLDFTIDLGSGNKLHVQATRKSTLRYCGDVDSLLKKVVASTGWMKDKVQDKTMSLRIEYQSSPDGQDMISIKQFPPAEKHYIIQNGEPFPLKKEQDSIIISGSYPPGPATPETTDTWSLNFYLNNTRDIELYINTGLPAKLHAVEKAPAPAWVKTKSGLLYLRSDPTIAVKTDYRPENRQQFITPILAIGVQNYRNRFVPSFTEGIIFSNVAYNINHSYGIYAEQLFGFTTNSEGKFKSELNHMISISYDQHDLSSTKEIFLPIHFSLGYLVKGKSAFIDEGSFRLGAGKVTALKGKTIIEPILYFNSFFKDVTPGIRLLQRF